MANPNYSLVGHEIETPLLNAAGSINGTNPELILSEVKILASTAIGAITVGSFTVPKQAGNEEAFGSPTYYHNELTGETYNSMGLPNIGLTAAKKLMPEITMRARDRGKPVIASVSPTQSSPENGGDAFEQVERLVEGLLATDADLIEINTSCPNVVTESGGRKPILGYDLEAMEELLGVLKTSAGVESSRIGLKLPPYMNSEEVSIVPQLTDRFRSYRDAFNFIVTSNTIPNQIACNALGKHILSVPDGAGGLSGPAMRHVGREQLKIWRNEIGDDFEIISTLGVDSGAELAYRRELGAAAAGGVTFLWQRRNWGMAVTEVISDWAAIEGRN